MSPAVSAGLVAGLFSLGMFVLVEHRRGEAAMMPLDLFGSSDFVGLAGFTSTLRRSRRPSRIVAICADRGRRLFAPPGRDGVVAAAPHHRVDVADDGAHRREGRAALAAHHRSAG